MLRLTSMIKRTNLSTHSLFALACLSVSGIAADTPVPAAVPIPATPSPKANVQIQIGNGAQLQIRGDGQLEFNGGTSLTVQKAPKLGQPPMLFIPGFPFHPLPNVAAAKAAKPGFLGVTFDITGGGAEEGDAKKTAGVSVLNVVQDTPAAKAGMKDGDRVLTFEGKKATDFTQLREMIRATKPDQAVKLIVLRDGKEVEIKAKLAAAPDEALAFPMILQNGPKAVPGVVTFGRDTVSASTNMSSGVKAPADDKDTVSLRDGNRFLGKITGIDPAKGVNLQREGLPDLDLMEEEIVGLTFADREKTKPSPAKVHLQLRDGGWFNGDALTMGRGKLLLTLPGGGQIAIPEEHAQSATLSKEQAPQIYDGPMGLAGWTFTPNRGQWDFKDGFLRCIAYGPISRNFEHLPDPLDLSFDVVCPPMLQNFGVTLFGSGAIQNGVGALSVQFSPTQIYGMHFDGRRSNQYNVLLKEQGGIPLDLQDKPQTVHYRLLVDRVNGKALIYIDGIKKAEWKLSKVNAGEIGKCGGTFSFSPNAYSSANQIQLGRILILPWDGKEPANGAKRAEVKSDQVLTSDGTTVNGTIETVTAGKITLANPPGTTSREGTLYLRFAPPAKPKEQAVPCALVRLKNGSEFAATQITGSGGKTTLTTRFGSQVTLPLSALREVEILPRPGQIESPAQGLDVLTLTNGTQLKGRMLAQVADDKLRWKIAASKTPLEFPSALTAGVCLSKAEGEQAATLNGSSIARLGNGDWLPCNVVSLDGKQVVMKTGLTTELIVPFTELRALYLSPDVTATVADGATGSGLWTGGWNPNRANMSAKQIAALAKSEPQWMYHDGGYTPTAAARSSGSSLARKWPAYAGAYAVNLEMTNPGRSPVFNTQLYNSRGEPSFTIYRLGERVNVYFNPNAARLHQFAGGGKRFNIEAKADSAEGSARIGIVLDRPEKTFRVLIDGKEIGKMAFKENEAAEALDVGGISLSAMSTGLTNGSPQRITGIWLAPWEGMRKGPTAPNKNEEGAAPDAKPEKDAVLMPTIHLANGDECAGTIEKFSAGQMMVNSEAGPIELPSGRVAWISFPGSAADEERHFPHLRFHDSGMLSVNDLHIESDRVKCKTMHGQPLDFPLNLVKEIVWRPLEEKPIPFEVPKRLLQR